LKQGSKFAYATWFYLQRICVYQQNEYAEGNDDIPADNNDGEPVRDDIQDRKGDI